MRSRTIQVLLAQPRGFCVRDICYATQNRQQSVHDLAKLVDLLLVVGSSRVGLTAGVSAPETLVQGVMTGLRRFGENSVSTVSDVAKDVKFKFPAEVH